MMSLSTNRCRWALGPEQHPHDYRVTCRPDTRFERASTTRQATKTRQSIADSYQNIGMVNQHEKYVSCNRDVQKGIPYISAGTRTRSQIDTGMKPFTEKS